MAVSVSCFGDAELNCYIGPGLVNKRCMSTVANHIGHHWQELARELITDSEVDAIKAQEDGVVNRTYQVIRKWKEQNASAATLNLLAFHLKTIGRNDLVEIILTEPVPLSPEPIPYPQIGSTVSPSKQEVLQKIAKNLRKNYESFQMKGLPWMSNIVLTLGEYYVNLIMTKVDQRGREVAAGTFIEDIFESVNKNAIPDRILVEGGSGSGKTTLSAKLAYDWAKEEKYISHFDLVLLLPLRLFQGTWEETLQKASLVCDKNKESFMQIVNDESKKILFILDGYDEALPKTEQEILPLLNKDLYSHVSVIITSRRGKFNSSREDIIDNKRFFSNADVAPVFAHFIDKRIIINGFNEEQQKMFVDKHMETFSDQQKAKVRERLDKMVDKEFLTCPLFLLMLIVVFTSNEDAKNTETKTALYKHVFNLVIKRYFSKTGNHAVQKMDLFSFEEIGKNLPHVALMTQFSQFALKAIKKNSHVFTREEIVKTYNCDPRILSLGFLKENFALQGFEQCVTYEPVHKSLLEFAAVYGVCLTQRHDNLHQFASEVTAFRPREGYASLFWPFLMGLLKENAGVLFTAIISYAFEYSCKFEYLQSSLMETELTNSILKCLTPFIPPKWNMLSPALSEKTVYGNNFLTSPQHKALIRWGVQQGKICQISWDLVQDALLPTDVVVDTLVLDMRSVEDIANLLTTVSKNTQYQIWQKTRQKVHCKYLWCAFRNSFRDTGQSLQGFLACLSFIDFQLLSFEFSHDCDTVEHQMLYETDQQLIPHICSVLTERELKNVHMYTLADGTCTYATTMLNTANELATAERLQSLEMYVADGDQGQTDNLVESAAKSSYLRNFVFGSKSCCAEGKVKRIVSLTKLCNDGQKSWEWVELAKTHVEWSDKIEDVFLIHHLDVATCSVLKSTSNLMCHCHVKSLNCPASLLAYTSPHWPYEASLTELNILVDIAFIYRGLYSIADKLRNLQILALTMTPLGVFTPLLPFDEWLWNAFTLLRLKGFEIWQVSKNVNLAKDLVEGLVKCLERRPAETFTPKESYRIQESNKNHPSQTESIHLEYLMLSDTASEFGNHATWCLQQLKTCLQCNCLQRLDMVFSTENKHSESFQLRSIFLAAQVFPREEGFTVEHDLWGSKADDSIYSKGKHRMSLSQKDRISVTFSQPLCLPTNGIGSYFLKSK